MDPLDIGTSAIGSPDRRGDVLSALRRERLAANLVALFGAADTEIAFLNFDGITYGKGASVLKQLVKYIGRDAFRAAQTAAVGDAPR